MDVNKIIESGYEYIGIRWMADDESYSIGDTCRNSYDWDYENDISTYLTEDPIELNGACAINTDISIANDTEEEIQLKIEYVINKFRYCGNVIIIGGNRMEYGADDNEIIIEDATVIDLL
jgi:hypothetical protein